MTESLVAKAGGSSRSALTRASICHRLISLYPLCPFFSSIVPPSTLYRHINAKILSAREEIEESLSNVNMLRLHWIDNYAKHYASNSMFSNRDLFRQCLWTAHGFKELPIDIDLSWRTLEGGDTVAALPNLEELLSELHFTELTTDLTLLSKSFFDESIVVLRDVRRIPLKVVATDDLIERAHLDSSDDGLKHFIPVDIYMRILLQLKD